MSILVVIAKECLPGKVKTRLHPPLSLMDAATLASASLNDTLNALGAITGVRHVLAFDGATPPPAAADWEILPQVGGGLDTRLAAIFDHCDEPTVLVGMDTPQVTAELLAPVFAAFAQSAAGEASVTAPDAWFGPATDGGFWALGLNAPTGALLRGVPMSRADTGAVQLARLRDAGLRVQMLPQLTDVDTIDSAREVAGTAPNGGFAATLTQLLASTSTSTGVTS
ncbi:MAG: DUF2064 domain-containing protein [Cryobacterium sp.]